MTAYTDQYWLSSDGLRLHYRDYAGDDARDVAKNFRRPPIICLPGLTRNGRDFEGVAARLAGQWRVICPDLRGRGDSAYAKTWTSYHPLQYIDDLNGLIADLGLDRFILFGTSLGGVLAMMLALGDTSRIAGALINDIGPVIEDAGIARIKGVVGQGRTFPTWMHAARALEEGQSRFFPDYRVDDWLRHAKRVMTVNSSGRIVYDYDMKLAEPFEQGGLGNLPDLWPGLMALAQGPLLVLRGELSDLLSAKSLRMMQKRCPEMEAVTVPHIGHPPSLEEPQAAAAIERLLAKIA